MAYVKAMHMLEKTADETINSSTTFQDNNELQVTLEAGKTYAFRLVLFFDTVAAADFKIQMAYTGTETDYRAFVEAIIAGATTISNTSVHTATSTAESLAGAGTTGGYVQMDGFIKTSTAGVFSVQWAQDTSDAGNTTVREGSRLYIDRF